MKTCQLVVRLTNEDTTMFRFLVNKDSRAVVTEITCPTVWQRDEDSTRSKTKLESQRKR